MTSCQVTSLTHQHSWCSSILSRNKIRHKLVRNKTQIRSLSGVQPEPDGNRLCYRWEQITVHFNWTIIIHDRRRDQVNMSSLTRWRGAPIYCTRLGSINKAELGAPLSRSFSPSVQMVALVQRREARLSSAAATLPENYTESAPELRDADDIFMWFLLVSKDDCGGNPPSQSTIITLRTLDSKMLHLWFFFFKWRD